MWRVKISPTLIILLGFLVLSFGYLCYMAIDAQISRSNSLIEAIAGSLYIVFFVPVLLFIVDLLTYLFFLRFSDIYKATGMDISNQGINFQFKSGEEFVDYNRISKLSYDPYQAVVGGVVGSFFRNCLVAAYSSFRLFYTIEIKRTDGSIGNIFIPLNIKNIDKAIEIISSRLEKNKVNIGFLEGKPTTSYIPEVTSPELVNRPIGKWLLLFWPY